MAGAARGLHRGRDVTKLALAALFAISSAAFGGSAFAFQANTIGGNEDGTDVTPGETITSQGESESTTSTDFPADQPALRPHDLVVDEADPVCAEEIPAGVFIDPISGEIVDLYECAGYWVCGGERVDDIYTGRVSGADSGGMYAQYVGEIVGLISSVTLPLPEGGIDVDSLSQYLLEAGLGDPTHDAALPVFYWCQRTDSPFIELFEPGYAAHLGWDTSFLAEYPIDVVRQSVLDDLLVALDLYEPQLRAIPPLEGGFTYVQFPMWLWVHELKEFEFRWAVSDLETIFIGMRAKLVGIDWQLADETIRCSVDDMLAYDSDTHDVVDDRPACSHIFRQLDTVDIEATLVYEVEEKIAYRNTTLEDFPDVPWADHPTQADVELTSTTGPIEIHELLALNVASE